MYAYIAINGNNDTGKLYPKQLTPVELARSVSCFKDLEVALAALQPYRGKESLGVINVGYVQFRRKEPVEPVPPNEPRAESETTNTNPLS